MHKSRNPWEEMRKKYEAGGYSYRRLAEEYGVAVQSVSVHARSELWKGRKRRADTGQKCLTQVREALMNAAEEAARQARGGDVSIKELKELADVLQKLAGLEKTLGSTAAPEPVQVVLEGEAEELSR